MATISELLTNGVEHHQNGRLADAERVYRQILESEPDHSDALHLLGVAAHQVGNHELAIELIGRSIQLNGDEAHIHNNLGGACRACGRFLDAITAFGRALELNPDYFEANINLANTFRDCGKLDEAVACYRQAIKLQPNLPVTHLNLGVILNDLGIASQAIECYRRALELNPSFPEAFNNLGIVLHGMGNRDEAIACYRRALALNPQYADAMNNFGNVLCDQGSLDEGIAFYRQALGLHPGFAQAHNNLGFALKRQGKLDEAVTCFRRAMELKPDDAEICNNLGAALKSQGKLDEAIVCCRRALALNPNDAEAHNHLGNVLKDQGNLEEAIACYRRAVELKPNLVNAHSNLIYTRLFSPGYDAQTSFEEHRGWNDQHAAPLARMILPHRNDRAEDRRLRIGYVSPDFRNHVVGRNLIPLFQEHDHQRFEIHCYADVPSRDGLTDRFESDADVWHDTSSLNDEQLASLIRLDEIDILVDLTLHMAQNRLLVFARKPAPVQVTFAGYPGTTGLTAIDYRLTDPYLDPPGLNDRFYSETSVRLSETFWCYDPLESEAQVNSLPMLKTGQVTFGCLNNFCKVNQPVLRIWARVLNSVESSRLLILAGEGTHRQRAWQLLENEGIARDRVTFVSNRPREQYLAYYHEIDIGLDTVPYNGHSTSLDSYWMGVPVVTLVGPTVAGRAGLSQLNNLGLTELIAQSTDQYVQIATELARDLPRLTQLRATLRSRMQASPLMDAPRFARSIEAAYIAMWLQRGERRN